MSKIVYLQGDLLEPQTGESTKYLIHCVNNVYGFGSGIAGAIATKWPFVRGKFLNKDYWGLGDVQYVRITHGLYVINLCAQRGIGNFYETIPFRYESLQDGLIEIRENIRLEGIKDVSLNFPRLGAGNAKASWAKVEEVIDRVFSSSNIPLYVYDLPGVTTFRP